MSTCDIFTIGHSNHTVERFAQLLVQHKIEAIADVRSSPFSRFNPQFNRDLLQKTLQAARVRYVFLGQELGARSDDPGCYESGRVQYGRLAQTELFRRGLERVLRGARDYRIALMCAEKDPLDCHRTILVSRELIELGASVGHIHADGTLEAHEMAMQRLLSKRGLPSADLFRSRRELVAEALRRQEEEIAYVRGSPNELEERA